MLFSIKYVHRLKWNGLYQSLMWSCFGIMFMLLYPVSPDLMTFIGGVMPVSYTHLDVYKRQAYNRKLCIFYNKILQFRQKV